MNTLRHQTFNIRILNHLFTVAFLALGVCAASAQSEVKIWSKLVGAFNYDFGGGIATDPAGNIVVGGPTQSSLGGQSAGVFDVWVGKFDPSGNPLWLAQRGTAELEYGFDDPHGGVASDPDGNVLVVGRTKGALDGNSNLGNFDFFVMKFGPAGNWLWTRQDGAGLDDSARAVATDASGNVFVTGYVGAGNFHGVPRVGAVDVFISKYSPAGVRLWSAIFGSLRQDEAFGITCDADGNVIVTGWCDDSIEGNPYLANGDLFLAKYDSNGQRLWLKQWGTFNKDTGYALATDAARNIYLAGYTTGPLYGSPAGDRDVFLAKFDANGNNLWGRQIGSGNHDQGWGVTADAAGNVFLAGQAGDQLGNDPAAGNLDLFVAKYDTGGNQLWLRQMGTTNEDLGRAIAVDTNGHVFVTGWSYGDFDAHTNAGLADVVLLKFAPSNSPPPVPTALAATALTTSGFTANWHPAIPAAGYRLDVSTNAGFSNFLSGYQDLDMGNVLSRTVTGLSPGTTCYYRIRAYNPYGTSGNSAVIMATTVIPTCTPATLLNGSFEEPDIGGLGTNWTSYLRPPNPLVNTWTIQVAGPPPGGGTRYQQIATTNSLGGGAGVRQTITGCTVGATYVVSGWVRGNSDRITCRVKVSPSASANWATAMDLDPPFSVRTNNWVPFSGTVVATGTNMTLWLDGEVTVPAQFKAACFDVLTVTCLATPVPLRFASVSVSGTGHAQLVLSGPVGQSVTIRQSSNLTNWFPLTTLTNETGTLQYTDTSAAGVSPRFYQATTPEQ